MSIVIHELTKNVEETHLHMIDSHFVSKLSKISCDVYLELSLPEARVIISPVISDFVAFIDPLQGKFSSATTYVVAMKVAFTRSFFGIC